MRRILRDYPAVIHISQSWVQRLNENQGELPDGTYVPSRPLPFYGRFGRVRAAWLVFTGQADALVWPRRHEDWVK